MDHPSSPKQLDISDASSKNIEDQPGSSHPKDPEPSVEWPFPQNAEQDHEHGCKYCTKKFSNKQALGGHYNAHKHERAMENTAHELHDNNFGYYGAGGVAYLGPYLGSYRTTPDLVDRSVFNNFPYNAPQEQHGMHIGYNAHSGLPLVSNPYVLARPVPGFNNFYPGWVAPGQFPGQSAYNSGANILFPNNGAGDASASSRPVDPDLSVFAAPMNEQQDEDESGLDLSLKL